MFQYVLLWRLLYDIIPSACSHASPERGLSIIDKVYMPKRNVGIIDRGHWWQKEIHFRLEEYTVLWI